MYQHHNHNSFLLGILLGGALGAFSIIIFKSKEGQEIQKKICEKYETLKNELHEHISKKEKKQTK